MKYKFRLIRPDIDKSNMLTLDESSIIDTPTMQRQTKQNVKNSIQVKFPERIWTNDIDSEGVADTCSRLTTPALNWSSTNAYAKSSTTGTIKIRMTPSDSFLYYSNSGFSWYHGASNYTAVDLSGLRCYIAADQSATILDPDYFTPLYQTEVKLKFWNGDSSSCKEAWFIDYYGNGGVGSWSTPIDLPLQEGIALIMTFQASYSGFSCMYPWTDGEGIAPNFYSGATDRFYI